MRVEQVRNAHFWGLASSRGLLADLSADLLPTLFWGFTPDGGSLALPGGSTHFGFVWRGWALLTRYIPRRRQTFKLGAGMYFACPEPCQVQGHGGGGGVVVSRVGYEGMFQIGGPVNLGEGRLRYIDGGSTSLLVAPPRKGDPCINHLHFPPGWKQSRHKHPSLRFTVAYQGQGKCTVPAYPDGSGPDVEISVDPGSMFIIPTGGLHAIDAVGSSPLDIVTYHPDTLIGWTDDIHPMLESTSIVASPVGGNDPVPAACDSSVMEMCRRTS